MTGVADLPVHRPGLRHPDPRLNYTLAQGLELVLQVVDPAFTAQLNATQFAALHGHPDLVQVQPELALGLTTVLELNDPVEIVSFLPVRPVFARSSLRLDHFTSRVIDRWLVLAHRSEAYRDSTDEPRIGT